MGFGFFFPLNNVFLIPPLWPCGRGGFWGSFCRGGGFRGLFNPFPSSCFLPIRKGMLNFPVLNTVEAKDGYSASGHKMRPCRIETSLQSSELIVDGNSQSLKCSRRWMQSSISILRRHCLFD